ncbi:MAG: hypothetical protein AAB903_03535 [Patescibacteria group bacterium]
MSLRQDLLEKKKPTHQFHDSDSLDWIDSHRPRNISSDPISSSVDKLILGFEPWKKGKNMKFQNSAIQNGIHGFRHGCRVAIQALILGYNHYQLSQDELEAVMFAGLIHDCRRMNDNSDPHHGRRVALWLKNNKRVLPARLSVFLPAISFAIAVHSDSYEHIKKMQQYQRFKLFVDILKTADGLDRYRFPRSDWWFSSKFVMLKPSTQERSLAFDMVLKSEYHYLRSGKNKDSIQKAWITLKRK